MLKFVFAEDVLGEIVREQASREGDGKVFQGPTTFGAAIAPKRLSKNVQQQKMIVGIVLVSLHPPGVGQSSTGLWLKLSRGVFTCVRWKVTLYDPTWQVTSRSSEMECH